ncbi:hypothetical protein J5N97_025694 [Dioscorea zingiberensis]|uniref:L-ascorbate oxidase n=1 Tax=Dioscorea zingiberensis TaxID=325984 RepID=A0A9D5C157_9LILI|nr:hypothetical protein J5N97_025694 [Dioscorea zingiberensis]
MVRGGNGAKARHFRWEVGYVFWSPDCEENMLIGINGRYPGPTIHAKFGTPWADGTASISQCPIKPDETFTYRFKADKAGTYFYHGHYGMQRSAGLYGSLIVDVAQGVKEPFHYDGELNLLLSDWYHQSMHSQMLGLSSIPFRWIGEPQSLLINGRGQYNCSLAAHILDDGSSSCQIKSNDCAPLALRVLPKKTYRIRIASTTSLSSLNLAIGNHKMTVDLSSTACRMHFHAGKPPEDFPSNYDVMIPPINPNSTQGNNVYKIEFNSTIDVILQNACALSVNVSEIHPWHLHGHDFWVLGYGEGRFGDTDIARFNLKNPPLRNTVVIFPFGWTAIRFVANNPGVWAFHCHIEPHLHMGMGVIFSEGVELVGNIPSLSTDLRSNREDVDKPSPLREINTYLVCC